MGHRPARKGQRLSRYSSLEPKKSRTECKTDPQCRYSRHRGSFSEKTRYWLSIVGCADCTERSHASLPIDLDS